MGSIAELTRRLEDPYCDEWRQDRVATAFEVASIIGSTFDSEFIVAVWLFGSLARNEGTEQSDIDIAIETTRPIFLPESDIVIHTLQEGLQSPERYVQVNPAWNAQGIPGEINICFVYKSAFYGYIVSDRGLGELDLVTTLQREGVVLYRS